MNDKLRFFWRTLIAGVLFVGPLLLLLILLREGIGLIARILNPVAAQIPIRPMFGMAAPERPALGRSCASLSRTGKLTGRPFALPALVTVASREPVNRPNTRSESPANRSGMRFGLTPSGFKPPQSMEISVSRGVSRRPASSNAAWCDVSVGSI